MKKLKTISANPKIFLPGTQLEKQRAVFIFTKGGLGDYINFMSAVVWATKENPHLISHVLVNEPFKTVAEYIAKELPNCTVHTPEYLRVIHKQYDKVLIYYPDNQLINATGAHLMDLGFMYYAQVQKPPEGYGFLPEINYDKPWRWPELLDKPYAVFTPGATARARVVYAKYFNELVGYTISKGITPVFLGKREFVKDPKGEGYKATFQDGYNLTKGIDLTEKTTLLEAVQIMSKACFVIGLDNGLLHFAGTTEAPIIFGHNVATVEHRAIRRRRGLTINIELKETDLSCIGCQSRMRYIVGHKFSRCLYGGNIGKEYQCLDLLFSQGCITWKAAIDHITKTPKISSLIRSYSMNETGL
jgi:ADP-heptose:LPS heptosyltransferase